MSMTLQMHAYALLESTWCLVHQMRFTKREPDVARARSRIRAHSEDQMRHPRLARVMAMRRHPTGHLASAACAIDHRALAVMMLPLQHRPVAYTSARALQSSFALCIDVRYAARITFPAQYTHHLHR